MIDAIKYSGFKSMSDRISDEKNKRLDIRSGVIKFNNPFLRATLGGIIKNDTILLGAETGSGKTQLATEIAEDAASNGKKVYIFALEADTNEWERRRKFGVLSKLYLSNGGIKSILDYQDWMQGALGVLDDYENTADDLIKNSPIYNNIHTFYKEDVFGISDFIKKFTLIEQDADLVIVDHIHYFDLFSDKHNEELSQIMHQIRRLTQRLDVPVVLIAHLRKLSSGQERKLVPDISDFHGSSELSKVCTRAIMLAPGEYNHILKGYLTYIKIVKNRWGRSRTNLIGRILYTPSTDTYDSEYCEFGFEGQNRTFIPVKDDQIPDWLSSKIK